MRLFLDTNVILDVLTKRVPWFEDSAAVLSLLEQDGFEGIAAAHSITTLFYLSTKSLGREKATAAIVDLLKLVSADTLDQGMLVKGLALGWSDFEDALQMLSAMDSGADYIVTRDTDDFKKSSIPVLTPAELLALLRTRADDSKAAKPSRERSVSRQQDERTPPDGP